MKLPAFLMSLVLCGTALPALAASPEEPVKAIMDLAQGLWNDDPQVEGQDYFDASRLDTLYSKRFADAYRAAAKYPIYDEGGGPFGYDVITNSQDGCPLKDVTVTPGAAGNGRTEVKVTFRHFTCFEEGSPEKDQLSELHFDVVEENGRPVIDDIHRVVEGRPDSLLEEMQNIAKTGAETPEE